MWLLYKGKNEVGVIWIVEDMVIGSGCVIKYEDKGGRLVWELSIDEFNWLGNYRFIGEVIECKDKRLFGGNVSEERWDVEYDGRGFRGNCCGNVLLVCKCGCWLKFGVWGLSSRNIGKEEDCIWGFNVEGSG